jgi:hypothetical protein
MKQVLIVCALVLIVAACGRGGDQSHSPTSKQALGADNATHFVVALDGQLELKRQGWSKFVPASFGTPVRRGDLLRLGSGQATIVCSDLTIASAQRGSGGVPCKEAEADLVYNGSRVNATRAGTVEGIPTILAPRRTKLLTARPLLRWQPVDGVGTYTVSVRGPNVTWSTEVRGATEVAYPASAPALAPGQTYKVTVTANKRSSDEEGAADTGFSVLPEQDANAVRDAEKKIRALALPDDAKYFLIANLYASRGLIAEALDVIEMLQAKSDTPATARLAGDLLLDSGLTRHAEEYYANALDGSRRLNDAEGQAIAEARLAAIYESLGNRDEAAKHYHEALRLYQELGDTADVKQIDERLKALRP